MFFLAKMRYPKLVALHIKVIDLILLIFEQVSLTLLFMTPCIHLFAYLLDL